MTLFGEPIGTWLSIAAFVISLFALLLARRKQHIEERSELARHLSQIKAEYGDALVVLNRIDSLVHEFETVRIKLEEKVGKKSPPQFDTAFELIDSLRSKGTEFYNKLGSKDPKVTDPVRLSSIAVEARHLKDNLTELHNVLAEIIGPTVKELRFASLDSKRPRKSLPRSKPLLGRKTRKK